MPYRKEAIETALAVWRDAERRLSEADAADREWLEAEITLARAEFQRLVGMYPADGADQQMSRDKPGTAGSAA